MCFHLSDHSTLPESAEIRNTDFPRRPLLCHTLPPRSLRSFHDRFKCASRGLLTTYRLFQGGTSFRAAVASCYQVGGLKQQKSIFSQFWRPEVQTEVSAQPRSFQRLQGRSVPGFLQLRVCPGILWIVAASPQSSRPASSRPASVLVFTLINPLFSCLCNLPLLLSYNTCD